MRQERPAPDNARPDDARPGEACPGEAWPGDAWKDGLWRLYSEMGVKPGDSVCLHAAYSSIAGKAPDAGAFLDATLEFLGPEGSLFMPSFNFAILHQGDTIRFDLAHTPSEMGYLSEVFRKRPETARSRNLFNPVCAAGRLASRTAAMGHEDSWGEDSPVALLYRENAAIVMLGADFNAVTMIHYAEQRAAVPYRFTHHFENAFVMEPGGEQTPVRHSTFRRHDGYEIDFNRAATRLTEAGLVREGVYGEALVRVLRAKPLTDFLVELLGCEPYALVRGDEPKRHIPTRAPGGFSFLELIRELWPLGRSLVGPGYDQALDVLKRYAPLKVLEFPTGARALDWIIPESWENRGGSIQSLDGEVLADLGRHPLMIAAGSPPFRGELSREELLGRIATDPDKPDVIPYHMRYYRDDWLICLPHRELARLDADRFRVEVDTRLAPGSLKVGEVVIPGEIEDKIVFPIHLDHPGQCNDNASGVAVAVDLIRKLAGTRPRHTLVFLFLPETIGSYAYIDALGESLREFRWGVVVDSAGAGGSLMLMRSVNGDTELDVCARLALRAHEPDFREYPFLEPEGCGNDERPWQSPGVGVPSVSISRYPYPEQHSSLDSPDIIRPELLRRTRDVVVTLIRILDRNRVPTVLCRGVPQLGRRGLWPDSAKDARSCVAVEKFFFYADGRRSLARLADMAGVPFEFMDRLAEGLKRHGLVRCDAPEGVRREREPA